MKLVVGLGNPGQKYQFNRHNVGFLILDEYATKNNITFKKDKNSLIALDNKKNILLLKPQTYMNQSGSEVKRIMDYYKIPIEDILVIQDDKDIEFNRLKLKMNSSSGGHNGIKDIINYCGDAFLRLKIGIKNNLLEETASFVLDNFSSDEKNILSQNMEKYFNIIDNFLINTNIDLINKYNGDNSDL